MRFLSLSQYLPKEYAQLMTKKKSPIIQYYPTTFKLDAAAGLKREKTEALLGEINDKEDLFIEVEGVKYPLHLEKEPIHDQTSLRMRS